MMIPDIGFSVWIGQENPSWSQWTQDMDRLQSFGASCIRTGFTPWTIENEALDHAERCMIDAKDRGLNIMVTTPQLANNGDMSKEEAIPVGSAYVGELADRFAQYATWWQVLNEHDAMSWLTQQSLGAIYNEQTQTYNVRPGMTQSYLEGVRDVISASRGYIKEANPDCQVGTAVTGVSMNTPCEQYIWRPFYDVVAPAVDFIGINGYPIKWEQMYNEMPARLRRTSVRYGLPVVMAECGLPTNGNEDEQEAMEWIARQIFKATRSMSVDAVFVYMLMDAGLDKQDAEDNFGVLHNDRSYKDGWRVVRNTIREIREP